MRDLPAEAWRSASLAPDLPSFLSRVRAGLREPACRRISLWLLDARRRALVRAGASDDDGETALDATPVGENESRRLMAALRRGRLAVVRADERPDAALAPLLKTSAQGAQAIAILPLPSPDRDHAGAALFEFEAARVGADARRLLTALAEPIAAALGHERRVLELRALRDAAEADREALLRRLGRDRLADDIVGATAGLRAVLERVNVVARSDLPVLIFGETGAGKEVIARAVHERSPRRDRPFIRVNCGAIPPDLIDSELFGHERGAFTGATADRRGWFEQADSGTLFLDEIGDLPLPAQVRLLRVLQDGTLQRVGAEHPIRVDVRIVAATHRDLPSLVERREFREDLWYRLASFPILLPPLRERRQDVPALAEHFVRRAARRFGLAAAPLLPEHLQRLTAYDWPGNVRELASVIDRAVIVGQGTSLAIDTALGADLPRVTERPRAAAAASTPDAGAGDALDEVMKRHIEAILQRTRGIVEGPNGAAAILRINPHTLRARMRKLGVKWNAFRRSTP